ncbi:MAG: HAD family hydrolase [Cyanobacteria bacterium J06626_23]
MVTVWVQGRKGVSQRFGGIEAVVFDKDGTLASVEAYLADLYKERLRQLLLAPSATLALQFGVGDESIDPAGLLAVGSRLDNEIVVAAHLAQTGLPWITALKQAQAGFETASAQLRQKATQTPLIPGALSLVQRLRAAQVKCAIASADTQPEVDSFVDVHRLVDRFECWQGVQPERPDKTDPRFLQRVCQQLDVPPAQTLVVGDSAADAAMASAGKSAGFIGFMGGWSRPLALSFPGSPNRRVTVDDFDQIHIEGQASSQR